MQYLIMLLIVIGLALSDIVTGWIKAHVQGDYCSKVMRKGGLNKLGEITVMLTAIGLEIGMTALGRYYESPELAGIAGTITAFGVFFYIVIMELISIFENYGAANPDSPLTKFLLQKLRNLKHSDKNDKEDRNG